MIHICEKPRCSVKPFLIQRRIEFRFINPIQTFYEADSCHTCRICRLRVGRPTLHFNAKLTKNEFRISSLNESRISSSSEFRISSSNEFRISSSLRMSLRSHLRMSLGSHLRMSLGSHLRMSLRSHLHGTILLSKRQLFASYKYYKNYLL